MSIGERALTRLYARLLRLYPRPFREAFAGEMEAVFALALEEARRIGRGAVLALCLRELRDLPGSIVRERWRPEREGNTTVNNRDAAQTVTLRAFVRELVGSALVAAVIVVVMNLFLPRYVVEGSSMNPGIENGDWIIASRIPYLVNEPQRGDVVILDLPMQEEDLIKRVVGLPGETIDIHDGLVWVDGVPLEEPYITAPPGYTSTWTLGEDEYFVLGDNRNASRDSHVFGPVAREDIVCKAYLIYWPPSNWGLVSQVVDRPAKVTPTPVPASTAVPPIPGP